MPELSLGKLASEGAILSNRGDLSHILPLAPDDRIHRWRARVVDGWNPVRWRLIAELEVARESGHGRAGPGAPGGDQVRCVAHELLCRCDALGHDARTPNRLSQGRVARFSGIVREGIGGEDAKLGGDRSR